MKQKYKQLKQKNLVTVGKLPATTPHGDIFLTYKRFDQQTGDEIAPVTEYTTLQAIQQIRDEFEAEVESLNDLIDDISAL